MRLAHKTLDSQLGLEPAFRNVGGVKHHRPRSVPSAITAPTNANAPEAGSGTGLYSNVVVASVSKLTKNEEMLCV